MANLPQRLPLISLGMLLILISVAPTFIGMTRAFNQMNHGEDSSATLQKWVNLGFHPVFIACGPMGLLLLLAGLRRLLLRKDHQLSR